MEAPTERYVSMEALHRQFKAVCFDANLLPVTEKGSEIQLQKQLSLRNVILIVNGCVFEM